MKRKKTIKMRGSKTHGYGSKKKPRGGGSKGGKGFAGAFKHKKIFLKKYHPEHYQKKKFKSLRNRGLSPSIPSINLRDLSRASSPGQPAEGGEIELPGYKVLSAGQPPAGIVVKAKAFSARAKEKIEKAGGKAVEV